MSATALRHGKRQRVKVELLRPSALGGAELTAWRDIAASQPPLRRAFLSPGFAQACEAAHGRAVVAVLHEAGTIQGFLPFQFASRWHQAAGLAERIGGELSDAAGLIARPGLRADPAALLRLCRLGVLFVTHLVEGQAAFGLTPQAHDTGHVIALPDGGPAYLAGLRPDLLRDTARRLRRAEREYGPLSFHFDARPDAAAALDVIAQKRAQYRRTGAADPFAVAHRLRLIEALCAAGRTDDCRPEDCRPEDCRPVLASLTAGGRVLARHLGLQCGGTLSYWFPVYDPAAEKVSPGRLLLWHQIGQAAACGITLIDRGEGDTEAKRDFSSGVQDFGTANWQAATPRGWTTPRGLAARLLQAALWRLG